MVTIKLNNTFAVIQDDKWFCKNKFLKVALSFFSKSELKRYLPYPDLEVAKEVIKTLGGEIIKIEDPGFVEGRIY